MKIVKIVGLLLLLLVVGAVGVVVVAGMGWMSEHEAPGTVTERPIPGEVVAARARAQREAAFARGAAADKQILFGDLHVHTTFSVDAFFTSLPALGGEGAHPPADACDFARFCSALDFWSINDHAEGLTPDHWRETVDSIRQCNDVSADPENPDVVAFLGWEWTQVGANPDEHYGHKNVVLRHTDDARIPARPIASRGFSNKAMNAIGVGARGLMALSGDSPRLHGLARLLAERSAVADCPEGVPVRDLPLDCFESTRTPEGLFAKLDDWGYDSVVIPHGTTWGFYTPPGSSWDKQLVGGQHDPARQTMIEVYSGHGNSEEYRDFRAVDFDADGRPHCPEPTAEYLPSCWRAGEIIRDRCLAAGSVAAECDARAETARQNSADAGIRGFLSVPGAEATEWLDAGQCIDCFQPSFNYRPASSAQYIMALRDFDGPGEPRRFEFGFMASSDNHTARPGTGYKEVNRREMTEATGAVSPGSMGIMAPKKVDPAPVSVAIDTTNLPPLAFNAMETERQSSFFLTGGLVAAHAAGRNRDAIWESFDRREVYGTSGPRILLWFDLVNDPATAAGVVPMGGEARMSTAPEFRVRAVGSFEQKPGCPDLTEEALSPERIHHLCRGECYNPSDERRAITRIEVVRIRPQNRAGEPVADLVEDPWQVIACDPAKSGGCTVSFSDPEFADSARDALYYVRAIEAPSLAANADNLRCARRDAAGKCLEVNPCWGDFRTDPEEECLAYTEQRAWSSPVFVQFDGS